MTQKSISRALLSLSDKTNLKELCTFLFENGWEMVATNSTHKAICELGFHCVAVESVTDFPEILKGRVKTLHPNIFGAILARPNSSSDHDDLQKYNITPFELVVCNLYPFQEALEQFENSAEKNTCKLIENIDIGGVTLLRAAAKNHNSVAVLCDPQDYNTFIHVMSTQREETKYAFRQELAFKALKETAAYDEFISNALVQKMRPSHFLNSDIGPVRKKQIEKISSLPEQVNLSLSKIQDLRYGENPHQKSAFYKMNDISHTGKCALTTMHCFHGKELSYNNMLDIEHAIRLAKEFVETTRHAAIILKHNNPCGVGLSNHSILEAFERAFEGDKVSPFGGIVCLTTPVTEELAFKLSDIFLEVILAPDFDPIAVENLQKKKNLRLVRYLPQAPLANETIFTPVQGGFLAQSQDNIVVDINKVTTPTIIKPSQEILNAMQFGMTVVKHLRSNAILVCNGYQTISLAGGFTNRVDAVELALNKAKLSLENAVLASDAFFPFPDSIELIHKAGVRFIVQPGGSVQDKNVIEACDKYKIGMLFTGTRHFKH